MKEIWKLYFGVDCFGNRSYSKESFDSLQSAIAAMDKIQSEYPNCCMEVVKMKQKGN